MLVYNLNRDWQFHLAAPGGWRWVEPEQWRAVDLPHDWSIESAPDPASPTGAAGGFFPVGVAWYRKTFDAPPDWRGKKVWIEFEGVYMNADVWLNGHFLGFHPYGYTTFHFDLTPYLKIGAPNTLKLLVNNACQPNSRWYSGSGVYRPARLYIAHPLHTALWGVYVTTPEVADERALVRIAVVVENDADAAQEITLRSRILAPDGSAAGSAETPLTLEPGGRRECVHEAPIAAPALWSPDAPRLYRLETEIIVGGEVVDATTTPFGVRSVRVSAEEGFLLNGHPLKLKGGCVHHDNGVLGAASYARSEERKVELLKANGFNAVRCAHNPPAPAFLDACDRLGLLVIDEAFDCWRDGKNHCDYHVAFDDWWQRDLDSMLLRDRNHPSVVMWSIGNELIERGRPEGAAIARMLAARVRALDPTRPVTAAHCDQWGEGWAWETLDEIFAPLDVGGYNYQWRRYVSDHERCPQRAMVGTESFPGEAFDNWMSVLEHNYVIGDFVWTAWDYLGEAGIGRVHYDEKPQFLGAFPWNQANCGDMDVCGFKRPQSYYRDIVWGRGDPLYIAVHAPVPAGKTPTVTLWGWPDVWPNWTWPGREGETFKVDVYSACEEVELLLNGQSLGCKPSGRAERFIAAFEVPYAPGALKAVGYNGGRAAAECVVETVGAPARIRLTPDRAVLRAGVDDLSFVAVEIVDAAGRVHPAAEPTLYFTARGAGEIAAVGSGNPASAERYRGNQRNAYRGRCLVVVKAGDAPGEIHLAAQADGLEGAETTLRVEG